VPELNRQNLQDEFNMAEPDPVEPEIVEDQFEQEWEQDTDTLEGLKRNIERANELLDTVQDELQNGNFSARLVEVAGQLINAVTTASKEIFDNSYKEKYLDIRQQVVHLKERQIEMRSAAGNRPTTQNLIVASREDVLKMLVDEKKKLETPTE
jgi:hypothetical protein